MADTEAASAQTPVKLKAKKANKPKTASSHPPYGQMIAEAITDLKERGGSSRQAIQKYITTHYKVPADNVSGAQLKLALKRGVLGGQLKQCKGTGASGSFKVGEKKTEKKPKDKIKSKKPAKKAATKKPNSSNKSPKPKKVAAKKAKKPKVAKPAAKAKSPKKTKKLFAKKAAKPKSKAAKKSM